jgi:hypothetical protein
VSFRVSCNGSGLCVVALSINLKLTTTLDRAITQNPCYVPLIIGKMYKRKTKEKFFIGHQVGFNGKKEIMQWNFETEADCDKKLSELNAKQKASEDNPILDPFSQFNRWWKVRKRVAI